MAARNGRWQPAPVILNLPRPSRRHQLAASDKNRNPGDLLDSDQSVRSPPPLAMPSGQGGGDSGGEERWRFQAEILRAECNFLRMEREVALRKLDKNRTQVEIALRSAMDNLISRRKEIDGSGSGSVAAALDEGIEELEEKLEEVRIGNGRGRRRSKGSTRTLLPRSCRRNFDRQASVLRRRLEKMEVESVKDIQAISVMPAFAEDDTELEEDEQEEYSAPASSHIIRLPDDMEMLKRKMEGLSKGMLERMEECSYLLSDKNNCSTITTSSNSSNKGEWIGSSQIPIRFSEVVDKTRFLQIQQQPQLEKLVDDKVELMSCCSCKEVVGRILQQVRSESEQWNEMQEMLGQVRTEIEELRSSRDHWRQRAISSEINFHSQHAQKLEWKQRAHLSEHKVVELQKLVKQLQKELQPLRTKLLNAPPSSPLHPELQFRESLRMVQNQQSKSLVSLKEKEKHILECHLKTQNNSGEELVKISDLPDWTHPAFEGMKQLNSVKEQGL